MFATLVFHLHRFILLQLRPQEVVKALGLAHEHCDLILEVLGSTLYGGLRLLALIELVTELLEFVVALLIVAGELPILLLILYSLLLPRLALNLNGSDDSCSLLILITHDTFIVLVFL